MKRKQHTASGGSSLAQAEADVLKEGEAAGHLARELIRRRGGAVSPHDRLVHHLAQHCLGAAVVYTQEDAAGDMEFGGDAPTLAFSLTADEIQKLFPRGKRSEAQVTSLLHEALEEIATGLKQAFDDVGRPLSLKLLHAAEDSRPEAYHRVSAYDGATSYVLPLTVARNASPFIPRYECYLALPNAVDLPRMQAIRRASAEPFLTALPKLQSFESQLHTLSALPAGRG